MTIERYSKSVTRESRLGGLCQCSCEVFLIPWDSRAVVTCSVSAQSDVCPTEEPSQYTGSPSLEDYQADWLRTSTLRSKATSINELVFFLVLFRFVTQHFYNLKGRSLASRTHLLLNNMVSFVGGAVSSWLVRLSLDWTDVYPRGSRNASSCLMLQEPW